jgi:hypothetical protein
MEVLRKGRVKERPYQQADREQAGVVKGRDAAEYGIS